VDDFDETLVGPWEWDVKRLAASVFVVAGRQNGYTFWGKTDLSPMLIDQVLRGQLGYQGVVITDAMDGGGLLQFMQQQGYPDPAQAIAQASVQAMLAGNDIVECPIEPDLLAAVVALLRSKCAWA
jgi:beta-glucosidase-like glycosyl hydrolase